MIPTPKVRPKGFPCLKPLATDIWFLSGGEGGSALQAACIDGSLDLARLLLEKGADPNLQGTAPAIHKFWGVRLIVHQGSSPEQLFMQHVLESTTPSRNFSLNTVQTPTSKAKVTAPRFFSSCHALTCSLSRLPIGSKGRHCSPEGAGVNG